MRILVTVFVLSLLLFSCNKTVSNEKEDSDELVSQTEQSQDSLPPVETEAPNTDYKPAFEGQTRVSGMETQADYKVQVLTSELVEPWGIVGLPDGRFLITQNAGSMAIVGAEGSVDQIITRGIPEVNSKGQGGLLGITLDPDFENNRMVFWVFSESTPDGNLTAVAKGKLAEDEKSFEDVQVIYRALPAYASNLHYGGRVTFDKEDNLYVSTGERSDRVTRPQAQELNSALGKIVRITKEGKPAPGNPFENKKEALPEIWSYGHRNVQGLDWHPETGELWESEFGPRGGDELNLIQPGKNYGWPVIGYGIEYSGQTIGEAITQKEGMEQPVYYWDPVLSPSGIVFYNSSNIAEWKNNLFLGGLNGSHIARLKIENNRVVGEERLLADEEQRFRDLAVGADGNLYAVTDEGRLYKIAPE